MLGPIGLSERVGHRTQQQRTRLIVEDISETSVTVPLREMKHNSTSCFYGGVVIAAIYEFLNFYSPIPNQIYAPLPSSFTPSSHIVVI